MTKEARKWAFKESIVCGIPTIILTAIIMYFSLSREFAENPLTLAEFGVKIGGYRYRHIFNLLFPSVSDRWQDI